MTAAPARRSVWALRACVLLVGALGLNCRDSTGPRSIGGRLAVAPVFPSEAAIAEFGLAIDRVRIVVVRPIADTLADSTVSLDPDAAFLDLNIRVSLASSHETFRVSIIALAGTTPLFQGTGDVEVHSGASAGPPAEIPVDTYVGPGASVDSLVIQPRASFLYFNDSLRFSVQAFQGGVPVSQFYVSWSTSDTTVARVNGVGLLRAPASRTSVRLRARTPSGIGDSVTVTFVPLPTRLVPIAGGGQTGPVGQPLETRLEVEVRAADNLPVAGVDVRFRSLSGGTPADTTVTSDGAGRARVTGTLGPSVGGQSFEASLPAFAGVAVATFNVTAAATGPVRLAFLAQPIGAAAGSAFAPTIQVAVQNAAGTTVPSDTTQVTLSLGSNPTETFLDGITTVTSVNGIATFSGVSLHRAASGYTLVATSGALTPANSNSFTVSPAAPFQLVVVGQPASAFAGAAFPSAVRVDAEDSFGNPTPAFTGQVGLAIGTNPSGGTLSGPATANAVNGVATFTGLSIDNPGTGYTLIATSAGLTDGTSGPIDVVPPAGMILWVNAAGGNWSNPANWSGGVVPGLAETAVITLAGTYTVALDVNATVAGLQLGGSGGTQTLLAASRTLTVSGTSQINPNGLLWLKASTLAGGTLADGGKVHVEGATSITTGITTTAGSLIRLQGNGFYSTAVLTVASGFTNNGSIVLTDTTSSYGATLNVTSGTLTIAPAGTIDAAVGTAGPRTLGVQLDNQGTLTVSRALTLGRASAAHANSGAINVAGGNFTVSQSGTLPSFTNSGSITIAAGDSVKFSSGSFIYTAGSISGGTLSFSSTAVTATQSFSTATAGLNLISSTWGGSGTLTVASGTTTVLRASTISAALLNQGTLVVNGASAFNGPVSNAAGATLELQGNGFYSTAVLTAANSFTNSGAIVLTDITSSYGATLTMPAGATLTNAPGGTIDAAVGSAGPRTLTLELNNQGTLTLNRSLTINRSGAVHTNSGAINVVGGNLSINQSGTSPSFTNTGAITIAGADSVKVSSGALNLNGGTISGGTLSLTSTTVTSLQNFSTATAALSLASSTWGGAGILTVAAGTTVFWRASTITAPLVNQATIVANGASAFNGAVTNASGATLRLEGNGFYSTATLSVANSFTNNGAIVLTDITSSYGATLSMPGATLTNAAGATIDAAVGMAGPRTLAVELNNQGTITLNRGLLLGRPDAAHANSGIIDVIGGNLTINQSGIAPSFTNTGAGAINIAAGDSVKVSSGAFNYSSGSISGGGTFAVTSVTVTAAQNFSTATAALSLASSIWGGSGTLTVAPATSLLVRASTINTALVNQGTLIVNGASAFNGPVTNASGATLRIEGNGFYSTGNLTVATGFTNDGVIELTDITSSYGAILGVSSGTLINASGGSITALTGTNGPRTLNAQLDNQGTLTVATAPNQALTISKASAAHLNSGTIVLGGGDLTVSQFGTSPSFTNTGAITVAAGDTFRVNNGAFVHNGGTISGAGALSLSSVTAGAFNVAHSIASMLLTTSTVSFATAQSTGATGFVFSGSIINGTGSLTNQTLKTVLIRSSVVNLPMDNQGTLIVNGSTQFTGGFTTGTGSLIRVQGNSTASTGTMTVASGFTNNGMIELTDSVSAYGAILNVTNGKLINAPGANIAVLAGANGGRGIGAALDNRGSLTVAVAGNTALTLSKLDSTHQNSGTIDVTSGDFTVTQSTLGSFTNTGAISIAATDTFRVSGGAFTHNSGTLGGAGTLVLTNVQPAAFNVAHSVSSMQVTSSTVNFATPQNTGATGFAFSSSIVNGPGSLTNDTGKTLGIRGTTVNAPLTNLGTLLLTGTSALTDTFTTAVGSLLRLEGNGNASTATLNASKGFVNNGAIELTDITSAYGAALTVAPGGTLVNAQGASISVLAGANGPRTLNAPLDNQGTLNVALNGVQTLTMTPPAGATVANGGTITVSSGDLRINQSGGGVVLNTGAIAIAAPDTLTISGGGFNYIGGTLDGPGTLVLTNVNPANFAKPHTLGSIHLMSSSSASFASDQSTASTDFLLIGSALNGPGTLTNAPGKTLNVRSSSIAAPLINQGTLVAMGTSSLDGLTTATGSTLLLQGNSLASTSTLTVNNGLVNNGAIELTDITSSYGATLVVKTLPLVNAPGGTIDILPGANGSRTIDAIIDNQGTFTGSHPVTINHPDAVHTNRGTIKVKAGAITFAQSGGNPSFTNQLNGIIDIDSNTVFRVTSSIASSVINALGGKIMGKGTLDVRPPITFSNDGEIIPGASPGILTIAGNLQIPATGAVTIELGGPTAGKDYDQLAITGTASIAEGTLNVVLLPTLPDPKGMFFDVVTFASGTGSFRNFTVPLGCNQPVNTGTSIRVICP